MCGAKFTTLKHVKEKRDRKKETSKRHKTARERFFSLQCQRRREAKLEIPKLKRTINKIVMSTFK